VVAPRVGTNNRVAIGGEDAKPYVETHTGVVVTDGDTKSTAGGSPLTHSHVITAGGGGGAGGVDISSGKLTDRYVANASGVTKERVSSNGRVVRTGGVDQHRSSTNGRIIPSIVENERARADTGVEEGVG